MSFTVEPIAYERIEEFLEMLRERAAWLEALGQPMWNPEYLAKDAFIERYHVPACFLAFDGGEKVGGFALIEKDEDLWPDRLGDSAFYIHKLVVRKAFSGRGYAAKILAWIEDYARERGKDYLRLDYYEEREYLGKLYAGAGFRKVDVRTKPDGTRVALAQIRL
jgi:GNAT superfamily N-acetyltransferase